VEMPPHGKRGKLPERVSHSFRRAWKSGKGQPDSHISTAPAAALFMRKEMRKDEEKTEFQLTDSITSSTIRTPASLRSENDRLHFGTSDWDQIEITDHLHRNTQKEAYGLARGKGSVGLQSQAIRGEVNGSSEVFSLVTLDHKSNSHLDPLTLRRAIK